MTVQATSTRYESLDAIRGVAVMGILAMNIVAFALPMSAYFNPAAGGPPSPANLATWAFNFVFVDSKMRGLFSMLFGASTLLVIQSAEAGGRSPLATHYARMFWLGLFGLAHFYFLWFGDILSLYAVCGLLLYLFRGLSIRALLLWAAGFLLIALLLMGSMWVSMAMLEAGRLSPAAASEAQKQLAEFNAMMGPNSPAYAEDVRHFLGSYGTIAGQRMGEGAIEPLIQVMLFLWESMALMLIGMTLFKSRMLTGEWDVARYRRWASICFLVAAPPLAFIAWHSGQAGFDTVSIFGAALLFSTPFDILMTVGWAALIMLLIKTAASPATRARLAATGRMAFSNYLVTTIVMTTIFYGYGLGLFGSMSRAALYLFCFGMWAAMLLWSKPWLDRFQYGPLEWIWRSLSRWQFQPMKRAAPA
ncbi:MAG: DUF418 domain-containing protein [Sphingomonadales bacterium]|nr:DUF418 domain-containing protein [Sphingomonadales bacterium]